MIWNRRRPTMAEKLSSCTTREELDAMVVGLLSRQTALTDQEQQAVAHCKIELGGQS